MAFQDFLEQKYDNLNKANQAEVALKGAQTGQIKTATGLAPGEAAASEAAQGGSAASSQALAEYYRTKSSLAPGEAAGQIGQEAATTAAQRASTGFEFSAGTSRVPGQGDGTVDKVPAVLAPGEAVLNRGAADHLGHDVIDVLNALGDIKMGRAPVTPVAPPAVPRPTGPGDSALNAPQTKSTAGGQAPTNYYSDGTSDAGGDVLGGNPTINAARNPYTMADFRRDSDYQASTNDLNDRTQNREQGPTPLNLSNVNYAKKTNTPPIWNGPEGQRGKAPAHYVDGGTVPPATLSPVPGQGGAWGPTPDAQPAPGSNTGIRAAAGMPGKPRPGYSHGTSKVPAKGAKGRGKGAPPDAQGAPSPGGPSGVSPHLIAALMHLGGGGGMPPAGPGAPQPMPMPMPQVAGGQQPGPQMPRQGGGI